MTIGAPFNPYRVFQGVFAPYWILEHKGIGTGAKLCYIRLLGFAGKDARCYPSLETLGKSLGVSDRQARDYVKELERAGLITTEQRGLRRTNVYLFLWTAELEKLTTSVTGSDSPDDTSGGPAGPPTDRNPASALDRNNCSALDRNRSSAPDRNSASGLDRKNPAVPIGINSVRIKSLEPSSSPATSDCTRAGNERTPTDRELFGDEKIQGLAEATSRAANAIMRWAKERQIQRLRFDRQVGPPGKEHLTRWTQIFEVRGFTDDEEIYSVLDVARTAADRLGQWRSWGFLTLQIQLAAEGFGKSATMNSRIYPAAQTSIPEEAESLWAKAKARIRSQILETAFLNWFDCTRQIKKCGSQIDVAVPDEPTATWLRDGYDHVIKAALADLGIEEIRFIVRDPLEGIQSDPESSRTQ